MPLVRQLRYKLEYAQAEVLVTCKTFSKVQDMEDFVVPAQGTYAYFTQMQQTTYPTKNPLFFHQKNNNWTKKLSK